MTVVSIADLINNVTSQPFFATILRYIYFYTRFENFMP